MHFLKDKLFWLAIALVVASLVGVSVALDLDSPVPAAAGIVLAALGLGFVLVTGIENDVIYGKLDNDPLEVKRKAGDTLRFPLADVHDWVYSNDEELFGFFSRSLFEDPEH